MLIAPVGKIRLLRVWTVLDFPSNRTSVPGVATASDLNPATGPAAFLNQAPGSSVSSKMMRGSLACTRLVEDTPHNPAQSNITPNNTRTLLLCIIHDLLGNWLTAIDNSSIDARNRKSGVNVKEFEKTSN
jgi:hypothetical protein